MISYTAPTNSYDDNLTFPYGYVLFEGTVIKLLICCCVRKAKVGYKAGWIVCVVANEKVGLVERR